MADKQPPEGTALQLVSSRTSSTGVVMSVYRAVGQPQTGSFGG